MVESHGKSLYFPISILRLKLAQGAFRLEGCFSWLVREASGLSDSTALRDGEEWMDPSDTRQNN